MKDASRRVWRAAPATLVAVVVLTLLAAAALVGLAYLVYRREGSPWIPAALLLLALLALLYAWRFGLHPRLVADDDGLHVRNPFSSRSFDWGDVTLVAPGENGLVVGSDDGVAEAWCVQKSTFSLRRGRFTRADAVAHELIDELERRDPPLEDEETGLRIRRARPDEARLLTRIERSASEEHLEHLFPPEEFPYPVTEVTARWRRELHAPSTRVFVLEREQDALGFVAFSNAGEVLHLGVVPHRTRRGYGSALLEFAVRQMYDNGELEAGLWVLEGNAGARAFYRSHGWEEGEQRRPCRYQPHPQEIRMTKQLRRRPRRAA
ncbi:GNAT family N-acetyltransferase [Microlunatus flavus]|uniref:PH domain-containing protein n=1 Tax=Microlunatus flavus TaxID=1036181 RepID=A0A1H9DC31_9ACTN|nr:GNAT family N-acetyltransferase [Microlunatus flavus]SEQ10919.1 PH domain-containing protein [Microlunatus flavus]